MALRILLGDGNEEWAGEIKEFLVENRYEVDVVSKGRDIQLALYNAKEKKQNYFAVVMNYEIKMHSGAEVLKHIKANYPGQKVVLVFEKTDFVKNGTIKADNLLKMGITEYVTKPITSEELKAVLEGHQSFGQIISGLGDSEKVSDEVDLELDDKKFSKVSIDEFYSPIQVMFDVFVRLSDNHYVKILHTGDRFSKERVDKYKNEKKIKHLYFLKTDRRKYIQFYNHLGKKMLKNEKVGTKTKIDLLKNAVNKFSEESYFQGLKPQVVEQGQNICKSIYKMVEGQKDLWAILRDYQDLDPDAFSHSYLVTLYASCIVRQFEWQTKTTTESVALSGMFHDIGKIKFKNEEMIGMNYCDMSEDQKAIYEQHPQFGYEIASSNIMISNSVKQVILQHHEAYDGSGFPNGIKREQVFTLANIICLADDFVHMLVSEKEKPIICLKKLLSNQDQVKRYNSMIVENFIKVFAEPPRRIKNTALPGKSKMVPSR